MANWYEKYLSIYGKSPDEISVKILSEIKKNLARKQSEDPLISVVVIAYNEECRLAACLWSLSELQTNYPIEILGVNNNSKDRTEEVYQRLGLPYYNEQKQTISTERNNANDIEIFPIKTDGTEGRWRWQKLSIISSP